MYYLISQFSDVLFVCRVRSKSRSPIQINSQGSIDFDYYLQEAEEDLPLEDLEF